MTLTNNNASPAGATTSSSSTSSTSTTTTTATTSAARNGHHHHNHHDGRLDAETVQHIQNREPLLCFAPPPNTVIHRPMVNLVEFLSSYSICLNSYEDRIGVAVRGETLSDERINSLKEIIRSQSKRQRHDSRSAEHKSPEYKRIKSDPDLKTETPVLLMTTLADNGEPSKRQSTTSHPFDMDGIAHIESSADECDFKDDTKPGNLDASSDSDAPGSSSQHPPTDLNALNELPISTTTNTSVDSVVDMKPADPICPPIVVAAPDAAAPPVVVVVPDKAAIAAENRAKRRESKSLANKKRDIHRKENFRPLINEEMIAKIMRGWRVADVGDLTIGDLYIMFGQNFQVNLEYSWVEPERSVQTAQTDATDGAQPAPVAPAPVEPAPVEPVVVAPRNALSNKLKQLLLLANMAEKTKRKTNCTCGHFCDKGYKAKVSGVICLLLKKTKRFFLMQCVSIPPLIEQRRKFATQLHFKQDLSIVAHRQLSVSSSDNVARRERSFGTNAARSLPTDIVGKFALNVDTFSIAKSTFYLLRSAHAQQAEPMAANPQHAHQQASCRSATAAPPTGRRPIVRRHPVGRRLYRTIIRS